MPKRDFALPGKGSGPEGKQGGSYPIPDISHARNALARVSQFGSPAQNRKVRELLHLVRFSGYPFRRYWRPKTIAKPLYLVMDLQKLMKTHYTE